MKVFQVAPRCPHDSSSQGRGGKARVLSGKTRQAGPEALISGSSFPTKFEEGTFHFSLFLFTLAVCGVPDECRESLLWVGFWPDLLIK